VLLTITLKGNAHQYDSTKGSSLPGPPRSFLSTNFGFLCLGSPDLFLGI
jgi:hypothetical protein